MTKQNANNTYTYKRLGIAHWIPINITKWLDGSKNGPLNRLLNTDLEAAESVRVKSLYEFAQQLLGGVSAKGLDPMNMVHLEWSRYFNNLSRKLTIKVISETTLYDRKICDSTVKCVPIELSAGDKTFTVAEMMSVYLHAKTKEGWKALFADEIGKCEEGMPGGYIINEVDALKINTTLKKQYPDAAEIANVMYDMANGSIQNVIISTFKADTLRPFPKVEYGYWPQVKVVYSIKSTDKQGNFVFKEDNYNNWNLRNLNSFNALFQRADGGKLVIEDAFATFDRMMNFAATYKGYAEPLRKAIDLINFKGEGNNGILVDVRRALVENHGEEMYNELINIIKRIKNNQVGKIDTIYQYVDNQ